MRLENRNNPELVTVLEGVKYVEFKKGEIILRPQENTAYLHAIQTGMVKVYTLNDRGEEAIAVIYGPGDLFPLAWIIDQQWQDIYFQAMTDCTLALAPQDVFLKKLQSSPDFTFIVLKKILEQSVLFTSRVTNLEFKFARERLAYRLLILAAKFGTENSKGNFVLPSIGQQDLGATINVSREGISRELTRFEKLGYVKQSSKGVELLDCAGLHKEIGNATVLFFDTTKPSSKKQKA